MLSRLPGPRLADPPPCPDPRARGGGPGRRRIVWTVAAAGRGARARLNARPNRPRADPRHIPSFRRNAAGRSRTPGIRPNPTPTPAPRRKPDRNLAGGNFCHGGEGSAPLPLALFTAALVGCVMTQIRAFSGRLGIPVGHVTVNATLHWEGKQSGLEPYVTAPIGFGLDVDLDSPASADDQRRLLDAAKAGCFIEQTLKQGIDVDHRLRIGDGWQDA